MRFVVLAAFTNEARAQRRLAHAAATESVHKTLIRRTIVV